MKNKREPIKDFFYNISDYILILLIIVFVFGVLFWRLNILFDIPTEDSISKNIDFINSKQSQDKLDELRSDGNYIMIDIPEEADENTIALILYEDNLIDDTDLFIERLDELKLNDSLNYGEYKIYKDWDLDYIIKILAGDELKEFTIKEDSNLEDIGNILLENELIQSVPTFIKRVKVLNLEDSLKAGDYEIFKSTKVDDIIMILTRPQSG